MIISIEKFARTHPGDHADQVETYSLGRFMDDLHTDDDSAASEADRGETQE